MVEVRGPPGPKLETTENLRWSRCEGRQARNSKPPRTFDGRGARAARPETRNHRELSMVEVRGPPGPKLETTENLRWSRYEGRQARASKPPCPSECRRHPGT